MAERYVQSWVWALLTFHWFPKLFSPKTMKVRKNRITLVEPSSILFFWMKKNDTNAILLSKNKIFSKEFTPFKASIYLMLPWFFNILLDIPSHTLKFFPTPFLMPISDYMIDGVPWGITGSGAWIWWLNLGALIGVGYIIWSKQSRDTDSTRHA